MRSVSTRRHALGLLATPAVLVAASACSGGKDAVDPTAGGVGFVSVQRHGQLIAAGERTSAPHVSGPSLDGDGTVDVSAYRGRVVLLNFWASWCPPCRSEAPDIEAYYKATKTQGFQVVGVNAKDQPQLGRRFVSNHGITYPSIDDPQSKVALGFRSVSIANLPWSVLIDRKGRVAAVYTGGLVVTDDLAPAVTKLLAGS